MLAMMDSVTLDNVEQYEGKNGWGCTITVSAVIDKRREYLKFNTKDRSLYKLAESKLQESVSLTLNVVQNNFGTRLELVSIDGEVQVYWMKKSLHFGRRRDFIGTLAMQCQVYYSIFNTSLLGKKGGLNMSNDIQLVTKFNQITSILLVVLVMVMVISAINVIVKKESILNIVGLVLVCSLVIFMVKQDKFVELGKSIYVFFMKV